MTDADMSESLLPTRFLFRFAAPCRYKSPLWTPQGAALDEKYRLVDFAELEGNPLATDFRAAWSEAGLAVAARVEGKRQPPWCRAARSEDSDGLQSGSTPATFTTSTAPAASATVSFSCPAAGVRRISRWPTGCRSIAPASSPGPSGASNCRSAARSGHTAICWRAFCRPSADRFRSAGASAAGLYLCGDRPRVGRADLRRRQSACRIRKTRASGRRWSWCGEGLELFSPSPSGRGGRFHGGRNRTFQGMEYILPNRQTCRSVLRRRSRARSVVPFVKRTGRLCRVGSQGGENTM